jgi:periplasmic copper chaperone A
MKSCLKYVYIIVSMTFTMLAHADLKVSDAWVKPTVPGQPVAGAYMTLASDKDVDLVEASSTAAGKVEIHSMTMEGNIMRMKKLERLKIEAGKPVQLKPGGFHIMLIDLKQQIKEGDVIPINLVSQDGVGKKITLPIKFVATVPPVVEPASEMHMHHQH